MSRKPYSKLMWGGFSNGRLDTIEINDFFGGENIRRSPAIFTTRKEARLQYEDIRRIEVTEVES